MICFTPPVRTGQAERVRCPPSRAEFDSKLPQAPCAGLALSAEGARPAAPGRAVAGSGGWHRLPLRGAPCRAAPTAPTAAPRARGRRREAGRGGTGPCPLTALRGRQGSPGAGQSCTRECLGAASSPPPGALSARLMSIREPFFILWTSRPFCLEVAPQKYRWVPISAEQGTERKVLQLLQSIGRARRRFHLLSVWQLLSQDSFHPREELAICSNSILSRGEWTKLLFLFMV